VVLLRGDAWESVLVHWKSFWVSDRHTSWRLSINSVFFQERQAASAQKGIFQGKKNPARGRETRLTGFIKPEFDVY
jgi:hypothetical protein